MNFFEHHIGDYDQATAHLTACEDGIYSRLIRWYYASEAPLPADLKIIQRRVRAHSRDERAAVQTVLAEFFELQEDGYHQHRCDDVIAAYHEAVPDMEAKRENARERQRRTRQRRAELFEALRGHDIVPRFDTPTRELERLLSRATSPQQSRPPARDVTPPVTRDDTANHFPLPTTQDNPPLPPLPGGGGRSDPEDPNPGEPPATPPPAAPAPSPAGGKEPATPSPYAAVCKALRLIEVTDLQPSNPKLRALVDAGATVEEFLDAGRKALAAKVSRPGAYTLSIVEGERRRAADMAADLHQGPLPGQQQAPTETAEAYVARMAAEREAERQRMAEAKGPSPELKAQLLALGSGMRVGGKPS